MKTLSQVQREFVGDASATHYWIRGKDENLQGDWRIKAVDSSNIHIINDPKHFGYEVVPIPNSPISTTSLKELLEQVLPEKQEGYSLEGDRYEVCRQEVEDRIKKILNN